MFYITEQMRKFILQTVNEYELRGFPIDEPIIYISELFYDLYDVEEYLITDEKVKPQIRRNHIWSELLVGIAYIDAFKMMNHSHKNGLYSDEEEEKFHDVCKINDLADVLSEVSKSPQFLHVLLLQCYRFSQLDRLSKIQIIKSLDQSDIEFLKEKFTYFQEDLEQYDIVVTLDMLLKEWKRKEKHQEYYSEVKDELNILKINGFIEALILSNYQNGLHLLAEIAFMDYNINCILFQKEILDSKAVIDFYENNDKEQILSFLLLNQKERLEILKEIKDVYIYGEVYHAIISKKELNQKKNEEMKRKLLKEEE